MKSRDKSAPVQRPRAAHSEQEPEKRRDYSVDQQKDGEPRKDARSGKAASLADDGRSEISNQRRSEVSHRRNGRPETSESLTQIVDNYGALEEVRRSFGNLRSTDRFAELKEKKAA